MSHNVTMKLIQLHSPQEFHSRAGHFLSAHEAENNLPLGITAGLIANPNLYPSQPYFAVVEENDEIIAAALMTPPHKVVLALTDSNETLNLITRDLFTHYQTLPGVIGPSNIAFKFSEFWQGISGQSFHKNVAERIYQLTQVAPMPVVPGTMRRVTVADRPLLRQWLLEFQQEAMGEIDLNGVDRNLDNTLSVPPHIRGIFLWEHNGLPVSMSGYSGPTPNGIRIGPVYTPPSHRRHGYAGALVAQLSQQLLDEGRKFCFLFTDLSNPTANHIYQTIGYQPICDVDEYKFNPR
jgi:uncharacterized protein